MSINGVTRSFYLSVEELAKKKGVTMAQLALAWSLSKEGESLISVIMLLKTHRNIGVVAPVVGTTSIKNLMDLIDAVDLKLTEEEIQYLEEPYEAQAIFGYY